MNTDIVKFGTYTYSDVLEKRMDYTGNRFLSDHIFNTHLPIYTICQTCFMQLQLCYIVTFSMDIGLYCMLLI